MAIRTSEKFSSPAYVDTELRKKVDETAALLVDGSNPMDDDFDMNDNTIFNLNEPVNDKDAANKKFVVDYVNQDKIQQSVSRKNVFSFVLNQSLWKTEYKTRNLSLIEKNLKIHLNLHVISFEINREVKPGTNGSVLLVSRKSEC